MSAPTLDGRNGFWTWGATRGDFPFGAFLDKLVRYRHTTTALAHFTNRRRTVRPQPYSPRLADVLAHRVGRLNRAAGNVPIVFIENRWFEPWQDEHWQTMVGTPSAGQIEWVETLVAATRDVDLVWGLCLEPKEEQRRWLERMAVIVRERDPDRLISHNGNWGPAPAGADLYEAGVPDREPDFFNGDHHGRGSAYGDWLGELDTPRQVEKLRGLDPALPALMVTRMALEGRDWGLEDWGSSLADWDHDASWEEMGARSVQEPPPPPDPPDPARARIRRRLARKYDLMLAFERVRRAGTREARRRFINDPGAQEAEGRLLQDSESFDE